MDSGDVIIELLDDVDWGVGISFMTSPWVWGNFLRDVRRHFEMLDDITAYFSWDVIQDYDDVLIKFWPFMTYAQPKIHFRLSAADYLKTSNGILTLH